MFSRLHNSTRDDVRSIPHGTITSHHISIYYCSWREAVDWGEFTCKTPALLLSVWNSYLNI